MKKIKMFAAAAMFCATAFAGYTAYDKATMTDQEKLMQVNLEALTDPEINPDCPNGCVEPFDHCWCNGYQPYTEYQW